MSVFLQDIGAWETVPGWVGADGIPRPHAPDEVHGGFDASIEEILHCVTDQGYGRAFPELDGREEVRNTQLLRRLLYQNDQFTKTGSGQT
jgi:hypothetical protein|eukprot:COSAG06_NODE_3402_length_5394_cov_12.090115_4_plen_90_part_00